MNLIKITRFYVRFKKNRVGFVGGREVVVIVANGRGYEQLPCKYCSINHKG